MELWYSTVNVGKFWSTVKALVVMVCSWSMCESHGTYAIAIMYGRQWPRRADQALVRQNGDTQSVINSDAEP